MILAWAFELTPEGIKRTEDVPPEQSIRHHTGRKLLAIVAVGGAIALALFIVQISRRAGGRVKENAARDSLPALSVPEKSIAVLPFENLSENKENGFFTAGVQDEILADLAKVADLKVISRTSTEIYKPGPAEPAKRSDDSSASRTSSKAIFNAPITASASAPSSSMPAPMRTSGRNTTTGT